MFLKGKRSLKKYRSKKRLRIIVIVLISIGLLFFLLLIPFIINKIYELNPPNAFFNIDIEKGDILDYYAQLLSLIATIILGVIAVVQTYRSQKKSDEINELQLSIARRELAVAEKQYSEVQHRENNFPPKFEVKIISYNGNYSKLGLEIRNVSDSMVCSFTILDFKVYKDNILVESIQEWEIKFKSLKGGEIKNLTVNTSNMSDKNGRYWSNVKFEWKFSCEDMSGEKHFYSATIDIPNTGKFIGDFWKVIKIG